MNLSMDSKLVTLSRSTGIGVWKGWCVKEQRGCPNLKYKKIKKTRGSRHVMSQATADAAAAAMPSPFQRIKETLKN